MVAAYLVLTDMMSFQEIPYKDLVASLGRPPKGIDRTRLEVGVLV